MKLTTWAAGLALVVAGTVGVAVVVAHADDSPSPAKPPSSPQAPDNTVAAELLGTLPVGQTTSLSPYIAVRAHHPDWLREVLTTPSGDEHVDASNADLLALIETAPIPDGSVLVVGTAWGCSPEPGLAVIAGDILVVDAASHGVVCAVAEPRVAVFSADADVVPVGSTDRATLVAATTGEPTSLPPPEPDMQRLQFTLPGCPGDLPQLRVSAHDVSAEFVATKGPCSEPAPVHLTFDIAKGLLLPRG